MRKIEFRAFDLTLNRWVVGYLVKDYIIDLYDLETIYSDIAIKSIGEYIGLRDKMGIKIFEKDIVKIPDNYDIYGHFAGEIREVYFAFGGFRLKPKWNKNAKGNYIEDTEELEIIGNSYKNL